MTYDPPAAPGCAGWLRRTDRHKGDQSGLRQALRGDQRRGGAEPAEPDHKSGPPQRGEAFLMGSEFWRNVMVGLMLVASFALLIWLIFWS
jgi:hypothetical protein